MIHEGTITENSTDIEIVRHALGMALEIVDQSDAEFDDEDVELLEFCGRVLRSSQAGDMTDIRREIAECEDDDGDDA